MQIFELKLTLFLREDITYKDQIDVLSKNINKALFFDENLKILHKKFGFKPYVFSSLFPFDKESKIYIKNRIYVLKIRSYDENFLKDLASSLSKNRFDFKVVATEILPLNTKFIDKIISTTPVIFTILKDGKTLCFTPDMENLDFVIRRISENLEKKYELFFSENLKAPNDFINFIEFVNEKPIVFNYKNTKLLANNFKIIFNGDEISQKLAKLAFAVGIGEKNSLGFGFIDRTR